MYNKLYINIQGRMIHELNLKLNEATLYAIIFGFSQNWQAKFRWSLSYIENMLKLSRHTVIKLLNKLIEKNLIIKEENKTWNLYYVNMGIVQKMHHENEGSAKNAPEVVQKCTRGSAKTAHNNNKYNNKNNNIIINNNTENKVFWENWKENLKNLEEEENKISKEEKKSKKQTFDLEKKENNLKEKENLSILNQEKKEKEKEKVPLKEKEKKEYGNPGVNKIIEIIKQNNDWLCSWTEKQQRQYTRLLLKKLKKFTNWEYNIYNTLDIMIKKAQESRFYTSWVVWPKEIYYNFEKLVAVIKSELDNTTPVIEGI